MNMRLEDWLDDLCVRFIINLPSEELGSVERICFQIEEAQWFYEDFVRPLDPSLPSLPLRNFSLRIFQHCPLFSGWPQESFSAAFSEFLAYKTRVPVRGAIMLNERMDQVVLVKGWKKNANWSFPRGKINKDEKDLDCAVREVYEETGFDINSAGLAPDEDRTKFIEVTMREQHMRLYIFRGIPMDTHFEPRTRKEISKIEWYKLSELPTLRRNKQQEGNGDSLAANANKFYMVAPFLVPLKKWISQQRKRHAIEGRHLMPLQVYEEPTTATEDEQDLIDLNGMEAVTPAPMPSDLPEVTVSRSAQQDPSAHLKALLNINSIQAPVADPAQNQTLVADDKSTALLNLLRNGTHSHISDTRPYTPQEQMANPPTLPQSPHPHHPSQHLIPGQAVPSFSVKPQTQGDQSFYPPLQASLETKPSTFSSQKSDLLSLFQSNKSSTPRSGGRSDVSAPAPYQRTGDPEFARDILNNSRVSAIPPAASLPKLSGHARNLLDAFKSKPATSIVPPEGKISRDISRESPQAVEKEDNDDTPKLPQDGFFTYKPAIEDPRRSQHQSDLLNMFQKPSLQARGSISSMSSANVQTAPVELAAQPTSAITKIQPQSQKDTLMQLFQEKSDNHSGFRETRQQNQLGTNPTEKFQQLPEEMSGFSSIQRGNGIVNQEPKSILSRQSKDQSPAPQSPQSTVSNGTIKQSRTAPDATPKIFHPQILRRQPMPLPQQPIRQPTRPIENMNFASWNNNGSVRPSATSSTSQSLDRRGSQPDGHKKTLLSLFNKSSPNCMSPPATTENAYANFPPNSPASFRTMSFPQSEVVSPLHSEKLPSQIDSNDRVSPPTRSRVGSSSSFGAALTPSSTRTTTPGDKAFLLGYLQQAAKGAGA